MAQYLSFLYRRISVVRDFPSTFEISTTQIMDIRTFCVSFTCHMFLPWNWSLLKCTGILFVASLNPPSSKSARLNVLQSHLHGTRCPNVQVGSRRSRLSRNGMESIHLDKRTHLDVTLRGTYVNRLITAFGHVQQSRRNPWLQWKGRVYFGAVHLLSVRLCEAMGITEPSFNSV